MGRGGCGLPRDPDKGAVAQRDQPADCRGVSQQEGLRRRHRGLQRPPQSRFGQRQGHHRHRHDEPREGRSQGGGRYVDQSRRGTEADARSLLQPGRSEVRQGCARRGGDVVSEGDRLRPVVGQADLQAGPRRAEQAGQGRHDQDHGEGHRRRSGIARGRAGQAAHRTTQEIDGVSRPFRFTFILGLAGRGTGLAAVGGWRHARASAPVSGPSGVISIDTLRADHLPAYGYKKVRTPAIDALAADGVVFERAYPHAPQTLPAHASLLSGRLPFETGVRDNIGFAIKPGERMLPQMLRDRGYSTAAVVSAFVLRKETGIGQGFDFFDGEMPQASLDTSIGQVQRDGGASEAIAEQWLASAGTTRAFLFLHLYEPHKPYAPPERFAEYAPYDGELAYADELVGRLLKHLKSHQLSALSTIVLLSDHGEGLGDHGEQEHGLFVYDEAIHVPLVIKQESNAGAGRRITALVQHIDR